MTAIGYGAMGLGGAYSQAGSDEERFKVGVSTAQPVNVHGILTKSRSSIGCTSLVAQIGTQQPLVSKKPHQALLR